MTNTEIIELFMAANTFTDDTKIGVAHTLRTMFTQINGVNYKDMTMEDLEKYLLYLNKKMSVGDIVATTYNKNINYVRMFIKYLVGFDKNNNISLDKFNLVFKNEKTGSSLDKGDIPMLKEEYIPFVKAVINKKCGGWVAQRQKVVTLLLATCYLRRIEVQFLRKDDIDFNNLTVFPSKTKGDKPRRVKIDLQPKVAEEIKKLYKMYSDKGINGDYVILDENGSHLKYSNQINVIINGKDGDGGIIGWAMKPHRNLLSEKILPHGLRKSGAVWLKHVQNKSYDFVRDVLGHESIATTQRYTAERESDVTQDRVVMDL